MGMGEDHEFRHSSVCNGITAKRGPGEGHIQGAGVYIGGETGCQDVHAHIHTRTLPIYSKSFPFGGGGLLRWETWWRQDIPLAECGYGITRSSVKIADHNSCVDEYISPQWAAWLCRVARAL